MKFFPLAVIALSLVGAVEAGTVTVDFIQPERFTDIGKGGNAEAARNSITRHLKRLGDKGLPASQTLTVSITDIDLAGQPPEINPRADGFRVLGTGADWPRIDLRYRLTEGDRVLAEGEDKLADPQFLERRIQQRPDDPVPYENRMLTRWFDGRFKSPQPKR